MAPVLQRLGALPYYKHVAKRSIRLLNETRRTLNGSSVQILDASSSAATSPSDQRRQLSLAGRAVDWNATTKLQKEQKTSMLDNMRFFSSTSQSTDAAAEDSSNAVDTSLLSSWKEFEELMEQTRLFFQQNLSNSNEETMEAHQHQARELVETWLQLQQEWLELYREDPSSATNAHEEKRRCIKVLLEGCHAMMDLLPRVQPQLAPHASVVSNDTTTPCVEDQLWDLCGRVMLSSTESMQAFREEHEQHYNRKPQQDPEMDEKNPSSISASISRPHLVRLSREIPQRTQFLFERLRENSSLATTRQQTPPTREPQQAKNEAESQGLKQKKKELALLQQAFMHVLTAWSCSRERNRGHKAETFCQQNGRIIGQAHSSQSASSRRREQSSSRLPISFFLLPPEQQSQAHKLMIQSWALSTDRQAAFRATEHLNTWLEWLRKNTKKTIPPKEQDPVTAPTTENDEEPQHRGSQYEPSLEDYRMVMRAWTRDSTVHAGTRAQKLMKQMLENRREGVTSVLPDVKIFEHVLKTASLHPLETAWVLAYIVGDTWKILTQTLGSVLKPTYGCYVHAIRCWKFVVLHPENQNNFKNQDRCVCNMLELWDEAKLLNQYDQPEKYIKGSLPTLPTAVYNDVLEVLPLWSTSPYEKVDLAESILNEMESAINTQKETTDTAYHDNVFQPPAPNARSYVLAIQLWERVSSEHDDIAQDALPRARQLLTRSLELHQDKEQSTRKRRLRKFQSTFATAQGTILAENRNTGYPVDCLNAYVNLCGAQNASHNNEAAGVQFLKEAVSTVESFRSQGHAQPDWNTYAALLRAASKLLPKTSSPSSSSTRLQTIQHIFRLACQDGMVEEEVLKTLKEATTDDEYHDMVLSHSYRPNNKDGDRKSHRVVPTEWTREALQQDRAITLDGQNVQPLTAYGHVVETTEMKEFRMRNLRSKRGQQLLRGGRWVSQEKESDAISDGS